MTNATRGLITFSCVYMINIFHDKLTKQNKTKQPQTLQCLSILKAEVFTAAGPSDHLFALRFCFLLIPRTHISLLAVLGFASSVPTWEFLYLLCSLLWISLPLVSACSLTFLLAWQGGFLWLLNAYLNFYHFHTPFPAFLAPFPRFIFFLLYQLLFNMLHILLIWLFLIFTMRCKSGTLISSLLTIMFVILWTFRNQFFSECTIK